MKNHVIDSKIPYTADHVKCCNCFHNLGGGGGSGGGGGGVVGDVRVLNGSYLFINTSTMSNNLSILICPIRLNI